MSVRINH